MSDLPSLILAILDGSSAARPVRISDILDELRETYLVFASGAPSRRRRKHRTV